ncbi:MAG: hypothetical protein E6G29_07525 [Actinobacteria bacterium]|nr:MAG: hypothetical protein E6G29_07525 [Actinomycetota bacterium]
MAQRVKTKGKKKHKKRKINVWVSWNGATTVADWRVFRGNFKKHLKFTRSRKPTGFETHLVIPGGKRFVKVLAVNRFGKVNRALSHHQGEVGVGLLGGRNSRLRGCFGLRREREGLR